MYPDPEFPNVINYRSVINDACVSNWEPMPEVDPPTLQGLVEFLKKCPGWDYRRLSTEHGGFDKHLISYSMRKQFYIPTIPVEQDFVWLIAEQLIDTQIANCKECGNEVHYHHDVCRHPGGEGHDEIICSHCDIIFGVDGQYHIKSEIIDDWNKLNATRVD